MCRPHRAGSTGGAAVVVDVAILHSLLHHSPHRCRNQLLLLLLLQHYRYLHSSLVSSLPIAHHYYTLPIDCMDHRYHHLNNSRSNR